MITSDPLAAVRGGLTDFQRGDIPALLARLDDQIVWETPFPADVLPYGGTRRGKEQVGMFFRQLDEAVQITRFDLHEFVVNEGTIVVIGTYDGTIRKNAKQAGADFVFVFRVRNDKIVAFREYSDPTASIAAYRAS